MTIWSWGANSYGQLAHGHSDDQLVPVKVDTVPGNVRSIACGGGHSLMLTDNGELWMCGSNSKGQLGTGNTDDVTTLTLVPGIQHKVTMVAGGWDFTLALTDTGNLYSWGSNTFGQLGDPNLPGKTSSPASISIADKVVQVTAGLRHSVALTDTGEVYCWGHAKKGQCGCVQAEANTPQPKYITPIKLIMPRFVGRLVYIAAGSYHTAALTEDGRVVVWGCNKYGQCAQDTNCTSQINVPHALPQSVFGGRNVKAIRSGWTHLLAMTDEGILMSWGRGDYGQLGRSLTQGQGHSYIPTPVDTHEKIRAFECGSEHCLFITEDHKLLSVGWNEHGLCGTGDEVNVHKLRQVDALAGTRVTSVSCGGGHCFAVTDDQDCEQHDYG